MRRLVVLLLAGCLFLGGCGFSVYSLPLPGGADTGKDPLTLHVQFADVLDLVPDSTVKVNYLGSVYDAKQPFDESYSQKPIEFSLGSVVKGWTYGLSGLKVGSRVILQIPPDLGYGAQEQSGIPANSTLYFVVDIISAK